MSSTLYSRTEPSTVTLLPMGTRTMSMTPCLVSSSVTQVVWAVFLLETSKSQGQQRTLLHLGV